MTSAHGGGRPSQCQAQPPPAPSVTDLHTSVNGGPKGSTHDVGGSQGSSTRSLPCPSDTLYPAGCSSDGLPDTLSSQSVVTTNPRKRSIHDMEGRDDDDEASSDVAPASNNDKKKNRRGHRSLLYPGLSSAEWTADAMPTLDNPDTRLPFATIRTAYNDASDKFQQLIQSEVEKNRLGAPDGEEGDTGERNRTLFLHRKICKTLKTFVHDITANREEANRPKAVPTAVFDHLMEHYEDGVEGGDKSSKDQLSRLRTQLEEERTLHAALEVKYAAMVEEHAARDALYPGLLKAYEAL